MFWQHEYVLIIISLEPTQNCVYNDTLYKVRIVIVVLYS